MNNSFSDARYFGLFHNISTICQITAIKPNNIIYSFIHFKKSMYFFFIRQWMSELSTFYENNTTLMCFKICFVITCICKHHKIHSKILLQKLIVSFYDCFYTTRIISLSNNQYSFHFLFLTHIGLHFFCLFQNIISRICNQIQTRLPIIRLLFHIFNMMCPFY